MIAESYGAAADPLRLTSGPLQGLFNCADQNVLTGTLVTLDMLVS
jgi:hypothetical protein